MVNFVRPSKCTNLMDIARVVSMRGECFRRKVGCVIVDNKGRILATGFNGLAPGNVPCILRPCNGASSESGKNLDICEANHAEMSALVQLTEPDKASTLYCTTAPCINCVKAILLTNIQTIIFDSDYVLSGKELWVRSGRFWKSISSLENRDDHTL